MNAKACRNWSALRVLKAPRAIVKYCSISRSYGLTAERISSYATFTSCIPLTTTFFNLLGCRIFAHPKDTLHGNCGPKNSITDLFTRLETKYRGEVSIVNVLQLLLDIVIDCASYISFGLIISSLWLPPSCRNAGGTLLRGRLLHPRLQRARFRPTSTRIAVPKAVQLANA